MTDTNKLSILVVDDEPAIRTLICRYLKDDPIDLTIAATGAEALEAARNIPKLSLLLTDVMMPELEGHELARQLRRREPDLKVLYLTGHADRLFDAKQQLWDLEAFLEKPFTKESLRQAIAQLAFGRLEL
jgi:two-component system cell cycle sensor histidine kinase/response regulator CckA